DTSADLWDIADGLLAGAIQYWLYTRQPCADPACQDCAPLATAEMRQGTAAPGRGTGAHQRILPFGQRLRCRTGLSRPPCRSGPWPRTGIAVAGNGALAHPGPARAGGALR